MSCGICLVIRLFFIRFHYSIIAFVSWIGKLVVPFIKPTGTVQSQSAESLLLLMNSNKVSVIKPADHWGYRLVFPQIGCFNLK